MTLFSILAGVRLALDTVRAHKLRSFLTVLGVIIGTGAVIGVGSIIAGLDGAILRRSPRYADSKTLPGAE